MLGSVRNHMNAESVRTRGPALFWVMILLYLLIFGYKSITRVDGFYDPDAMNFVDVARNLVTGHGFAQSTLGFNQPRFSVDDPVPVPFTTQAPLYPLLIAFVHWTGIPFDESAVLISAICFGLVLVLAYRISLELYDDRTAKLAVILLLVFPPLYQLASSAMSDVAGLFFLFLALWLIARTSRIEEKRMRLAAVAGLATGTAFAARYALAPLVVVGAIFIQREPKPSFRALFMYVVGFLSVAGLVWLHNWSASGALMPHANPSVVGLGDILRKQFENLVRMPAEAPSHAIFYGGGLAGLLVLGVISFRRRTILAALHEVFIAQGRYLLTVWAAFYLCFLLYESCAVHIDSIDSRLLLPSSAILPLFVAAFAVQTVAVNPRHEHFLAIAAIFLVLVYETTSLARLPRYDKNSVIAKSELLSWIEKRTTQNDLIIGDDTVYVPFYFGRRAAVSFSRYPYSDYVDYWKVIAFSRKHCGDYDHHYLVLNAYGMKKAKRPGAYGPFIADLAGDRADPYPRIHLYRRLTDGLVFTIDCS